MDIRLVSPAVRRRVGQSPCATLDADADGVIHNTPIETDWRIVEAAFAAKGATVQRDYTGA